MAKFKEHVIRWFERTAKRIFAIAITFSALVSTVAVVFVTLNVVTVADSYGQEKMLITTSTDPTELMNLSGITAEEYDKYYYTAYSGNLASLNIQRAFPVEVIADGNIYTGNMITGTVQNALDQLGVVLGEQDYTVPSLNSQVTEGTSINVHRVIYNDKVIEEVINYGTDYQYTSLLHRKKNSTYTMSEGRSGLKEITFRERT